jgi:ABC-type polysaccharide/polyol phosphate transport system ATPase subunit
MALSQPLVRPVVVELRDVTRQFPNRSGRRTVYQVTRDWLRGIPREQERHALSGVTLDVMQGDKIALIGNNAAGKSTLLKIIAGLLRPSSGTVQTTGEMVLLTALGVGMMDEVSVIENTLLYGALYGVEPERMRLALDDIMAWAEIEGYENAKLKTLSSGTRARLAFSIVRHIATDMFLIDEALSAGDVSFRARCRAFFDSAVNEERTFIVATHDLEFARSFCTTAIWLEEGHVADRGDSRIVVTRYEEAQAQRSRAGAPAVSKAR